jgi:uncharacterized membrane protein YdbT with pleckstrin-like domain
MPGEAVLAQTSVGSQQLGSRRTVLIGLAVVAALALVIPLGLGAILAWAEIPALLLACALIAVVAVSRLAGRAPGRSAAPHCR